MVNMSDCKDVIWVMYAVGTICGFLLGMCSMLAFQAYLETKEHSDEKQKENS